MDTEDAVNVFIGQAAGQIAVVTRIARDLDRLDFFHHVDAIARRLGDRDVEAAFSYLRNAGVPDAWLADARTGGPLATFDATHRWVERPYATASYSSAMRPGRATRPGEAASRAPCATSGCCATRCSRPRPAARSRRIRGSARRVLGTATRCRTAQREGADVGRPRRRVAPGTRPRDPRRRTRTRDLDVRPGSALRRRRPRRTTRLTPEPTTQPDRRRM